MEKRINTNSVLKSNIEKSLTEIQLLLPVLDIYVDKKYHGMSEDDREVFKEGFTGILAGIETALLNSRKELFST